jgi:hypothetical protein
MSSYTKISKLSLSRIVISCKKSHFGVSIRSFQENCVEFTGSAQQSMLTQLTQSVFLAFSSKRFGGMNGRVDDQFQGSKSCILHRCRLTNETDNVFQDLQLVRQFCRHFFPCLSPLHGSFLDQWGMAVELHETAPVVEL